MPFPVSEEKIDYSSSRFLRQIPLKTVPTAVKSNQKSCIYQNDRYSLGSIYRTV
ncbi:DUF1496 domain-containing protein [Lactobacillus delbrueckii subsp. lactis]|nr:hypothetical protein [Lactobacillus delbrueckii]MCT3486099.1 DUF1496 domain-containing protein [Lactobacillus delbrueckii subsp. lactis]